MDSAVDGALREVDVCLDRGLSLEPLVAQLVGDDLILIVNARGKAPLAGCQVDRILRRIRLA